MAAFKALGKKAESLGAGGLMMSVPVFWLRRWRRVPLLRMLPAALAMLLRSAPVGVTPVLATADFAEVRLSAPNPKPSPRVTTSTTDRRLLEGVLSRALPVTASSNTAASRSLQRRKGHDQSARAQGGVQTAVTLRPTIFYLDCLGSALRPLMQQVQRACPAQAPPQ